jgi:hypothetical protein
MTVPLIGPSDRGRYGNITVFDQTKRPVDPALGGRRIGHVLRASGHDVAVRQRFSGLVLVDTITTSGDLRSPLEAAEAVRPRRVPPPSNWFIVGAPVVR